MQEKPHTLVGTKAPTFNLRDERGELFSLSDALTKGRAVILFFYPGDMSPGCALQFCSARDDWKQFEAEHVIVAGINHASAKSHEVFSKAIRIPFPLLIDPGMKISETYEATKKFFRTTVIARTVVGIAPDGTIFFYRRGFPKNSEILKAIPKK